MQCDAPGDAVVAEQEHLEPRQHRHALELPDLVVGQVHTVELILRRQGARRTRWVASGVRKQATAREGRGTQVGMAATEEDGGRAGSLVGQDGDDPAPRVAATCRAARFSMRAILLPRRSISRSFSALMKAGARAMRSAFSRIRLAVARRATGRRSFFYCPARFPHRYREPPGGKSWLSHWCGQLLTAMGDLILFHST
jgi:hypothetical protein